MNRLTLKSWKYRCRADELVSNRSFSVLAFGVSISKKGFRLQCDFLGESQVKKCINLKFTNVKEGCPSSVRASLKKLIEEGLAVRYDSGRITYHVRGDNK